MSQSTTLATIDLDDLLLVNGGDAWQDYKDKNVQNWNDTKARANEAIKYNLVNGQWDAVSAGRILDAIADLLGEDPVLLRDRTPASIRLLVDQGFLLPVRP